MESRRLGFTVVMSNFNKASYLADSIESVLNQSYKLFDFIIIDDGSTDNSVSIIENYASKNRSICFLKNPLNKGANFSRNRGISITEKQYVIIMDSDDLLDRFCLENRMKEINAYPNFDIWVFSMSTFKEDVNQAISTWRANKGNHLNQFLSHQLPWTISQPVWRTEFIQNLNGFNEDFSRLQDVELHTRALLNNARVFISDNEPDCYYRVAEDRVKNYSLHYEKISHSVVQYFNIFCNKVTDKKYLFISVLYVIDLIWYGLSSRKLEFRQADLMVNEILKSIITLSDDRKRLKILKVYWLIKSKFDFNLSGLRFIFVKLLQVF